MRADTASAKSRGDPIVWDGETLYLLDQRALPQRVSYVEYRSAEAVADAITTMVVRGAPAIGISAAYGLAFSVRAHLEGGAEDWRAGVERDAEMLGRARPTAVNLAWALERMCRRLTPEVEDPLAVAVAQARQIHIEDVAANQRMGQLGADLLDPGSRILTHCNAGALATGGYGTALGVVRSAAAQGKVASVLAGETRPWLQGARLTAWELGQDGIEVEVISDSAAAYAMAEGRVDCVIVGADRVAGNGDVANKIGTYGLAVAARYHDVQMMVVAPTSTIDLAVASGSEIPIETRDPAEVLAFRGERVAAPGAQAWNPVFDVTPAALVTALVTEKGVVRAPDAEGIAALLSGAPKSPRRS